SEPRFLIRPYHEGDEYALTQLFYDSVHEVACKKYDAEALRAWAPRVPDPTKWGARMRSRETFVADRNGESLGFIELEKDGHIAMLYRSPRACGIGVAARLYDAVEARAREFSARLLYTEASLLAEPFFAARGYGLDYREIIKRGDVALHRARMSKQLS
ncbi:MAG: GNAT family N-acetyltransferase, partial [Candidatus Eremiobacteraeota bacterium]|nr:GNAT family N-acetyltransferase [Candidatus Eremiobacteraeota bacterium]